MFPGICAGADADFGWCVQLTNSSFTGYVTENILKPANLTNTYYWLGGQGMQPQGLRKGVVSIPGYLTTFSGGGGGTPLVCPASQEPSHMLGAILTLRPVSGAQKCLVTD